MRIKTNFYDFSLICKEEIRFNPFYSVQLVRAADAVQTP